MRALSNAFSVRGCGVGIFVWFCWPKTIGPPMRANTTARNSKKVRMTLCVYQFALKLSIWFDGKYLLISAMLQEIQVISAMDVKTLAGAAKPKMEAALAHFAEELKAVRTGRANAQILDSVVVSYYGTMTPLRQMATISVPEATQLVVQPFDANSLGDIRLGIEQAELGINMSDDGRVIRLSIPALTEERREEMVKKVGKLAEEARISIRSARGEAWEKIQESQKSGEISEDNRDWGRDELDKQTAEYNKKVEELVKAKEVELRTI